MCFHLFFSPQILLVTVSCSTSFLDSRVRNEPNASLLALGDCARVTYPAALQRCKFDTPLLVAGLLIFICCVCLGLSPFVAVSVILLFFCSRISSEPNAMLARN